MKFEGNRKLALTLIMLGVIISFFGGTVAYWSWETSESQKTEVAVTVTQDFTCTIDGGGSVESTDYQLIPTGCMDPDYAIQRTVTVSPTVYNTNNNVLMEMWIDVNTLNSGLSNSQNFKYALTTSSTSCTEGVVEEGTFNGLSSGGQTANIFSKSYGNTTTETYYLYIWLDSAETSSATQEQSFSLSLNGNCTNDPYPEPNAPELDPGMIPVTIANDGTVTTISERDDEWYDYSNKEWANVVLVKESGTQTRSYYQSNEGVTVSEDDILAYYVWIPRYKYKIPNMTCSELENPTIESHPECYGPYIMSDSDKELLINYWYGMDYVSTLEGATEDVETMLNTGKIYVETEKSTYSFVRVVGWYNEDNETSITYSTTYNVYKMLDTDKELFINWWYENEGSWLLQEYGYTYTMEEATDDVETMLNTGVVYIEKEAYTYEFTQLVNSYNKNNETSITYSYVSEFAGYNSTIVTGPKSVDILFESSSSIKSTGDAVNTYYSHPAFIWNGEIVSGIWVGKFETGHLTLSSSTTSNNLICTDENCSNADGLIIKPNAVSLRYNNISNQFYASRSITRIGNPFGLSSTTMDSHMMKNSEWGAVAYLSHSQYGINYVIRYNNNSNFITGCGASEENGINTSECQIVYGSGVSSYPQSTTGNVTGIFDMSGGSYEYVMGNFDNTIHSSGFTTLPNSKYYDLYSSEIFTGERNTNILLCTLDSCGGHSLNETLGWYGSSSSFVVVSGPWFFRDSSFESTGTYGEAARTLSWRSVLVFDGV